jgi:hypothetical protein
LEKSTKAGGARTKYVLPPGQSKLCFDRAPSEPSQSSTSSSVTTTDTNSTELDAKAEVESHSAIPSVPLQDCNTGLSAAVNLDDVEQDPFSLSSHSRLENHENDQKTVLVDQSIRSYLFEVQQSLIAELDGPQGTISVIKNGRPWIEPADPRRVLDTCSAEPSQ